MRAALRTAARFELCRDSINTGNALFTAPCCANTFADSLEVVPLPYEYDSEIAVHVMGLNYSKKGDLVKQFIEFTKSRGDKVFGEHGYVK